MSFAFNIPNVEYNYRGEWQADIEYLQGDAVFYRNSSYHNIQAENTNIPDADGSGWILIATGNIAADLTIFNVDEDSLLFFDGQNLAGVRPPALDDDVNYTFNPHTFQFERDSAFLSTFATEIAGSSYVPASLEVCGRPVGFRTGATVGDAASQNDESRGEHFVYAHSNDDYQRQGSFFDRSLFVSNWSKFWLASDGTNDATIQGVGIQREDSSSADPVLTTRSLSTPLTLVDDFLSTYLAGSPTSSNGGNRGVVFDTTIDSTRTTSGSITRTEATFYPHTGYISSTRSPTTLSLVGFGSASGAANSSGDLPNPTYRHAFGRGTAYTNIVIQFSGSTGDNILNSQALSLTMSSAGSFDNYSYSLPDNQTAYFAETPSSDGSFLNGRATITRETGSLVRLRTTDNHIGLTSPRPMNSLTAEVFPSLHKAHVRWRWWAPRFGSGRQAFDENLDNSVVIPSSRDFSHGHIPCAIVGLAP